MVVRLALLLIVAIVLPVLAPGSAPVIQGVAGESPGRAEVDPVAAETSSDQGAVEPNAVVEPDPEGDRDAPEGGEGRLSATRESWQRGFALWNRTAPLDSPESLLALQQLRDAGADTVSPVITWYVAHPRDARLHPGPGTPSDQELIALVDEAHRLGLRVVLRFHVDCEDGAWRANIDPDDKDAWFAAYGAALNRYAELAEAHGVEGLVVGTELVSLTRPVHTHRWKAMIAEVRQRFSGFLTYSAQWGSTPPGSVADPYREYEQIAFWQDLDYLGISAYFELAEGGRPNGSPEELLARWEEWRRAHIEPFQARHGMPLLFAEVGYRSTNGAALHPWDGGLSQGLNLQLQADLYHAFFESWSGVPWFHGVYFWFWAPDGEGTGPTSVDYPPAGKPAEQVLRRWHRLLDDMERVSLRPATAGGTIPPGEGGE